MEVLPFCFSTLQGIFRRFLGVARGPLQERPLQFQHGNVRVKSWQPMSNSWSASSEPDFVRALCRRKTVRNRQGKILYTELLKSWSTLGQFLANSPSHGKLQGSSLQWSSGNTRVSSESPRQAPLADFETPPDQRQDDWAHVTWAFFKGGGPKVTRGNDIGVSPGMTVRRRSAACAPPLYCHAIVAQILVIP